MGYPVYKLLRAVNRQYPNNGFINHVDVNEDLDEGSGDNLIDEDLRDLINEAIQETYIHIAKDEVFSFPTVGGQKEYVLPEDCDLRDIQEVTRTFGRAIHPWMHPHGPEPEPHPGETWKASFDNGRGTGEMPSIDVLHGTYFRLPECTFTPPTDEYFVCWRDESGIDYIPGEACYMSGDETFLAKFSGDPEPIPPTPTHYTASFLPGYGTGTMASITSQTNPLLGYEYIVMPVCTFVPPTGLRFKNWIDSDNVPYNAGQTCQMASNKTFTAQYESDSPSPTHYTASFLAGDGTGSMADIESTTNSWGTESVTLPVCTFTPPEGKQFKGWSDQVSGEFDAGDTYIMNEDKSFLAMYAGIYSVTIRNVTPADLPMTLYYTPIGGTRQSVTLNGDGGEYSFHVEEGKTLANYYTSAYIVNYYNETEIVPINLVINQNTVYEYTQYTDGGRDPEEETTAEDFIVTFNIDTSKAYFQVGSNPITKIVRAGDTIGSVPTVIERAGYEFEGWTLDGVNVIRVQTIAATVVTSNLTYMGTFSRTSGGGSSGGGGATPEDPGRDPE